MSSLKVRRVRFDLAGDDIPFDWHPQRPAFSVLCNLMTFFAPAFENFIVDATREAIPLMTDPIAVEEANLYLRQEAQHSSAHVRHVKALCRRWPGLKDTADEVNASFDALTASKPLDWRLAYTAVIENTFTPYFKVFLDHDDKLFRPGDERVASLFVWHFVEEIEHRSSALIVYNAVRKDFRFRALSIPSVVKHVGEVLEIIRRGFLAHVPATDGGNLACLLPNGVSFDAIRDVRRTSKTLLQPSQRTYAGVSTKELLKMSIGLVRSQGPRHNPEHEDLPPLADRWVRRFDEEPASAAHWYSVGLGV